jgi:hypothetical protein
MFCFSGATSGYSFLVSNYYDFLLDEKANSIFYDYWVQQVRALSLLWGGLEG